MKEEKEIKVFGGGGKEINLQNGYNNINCPAAYVFITNIADKMWNVNILKLRETRNWLFLFKRDFIYL